VRGIVPSKSECVQILDDVLGQELLHAVNFDFEIIAANSLIRTHALQQRTQTRRAKDDQTLVPRANHFVIDGFQLSGQLHEVLLSPNRTGPFRIEAILVRLAVFLCEIPAKGHVVRTVAVFHRTSVTTRATPQPIFSPNVRCALGVSIMILLRCDEVVSRSHPAAIAVDVCGFGRFHRAHSITI